MNYIKLFEDFYDDWIYTNTDILPFWINKLKFKIGDNVKLINSSTNPRPDPSKVYWHRRDDAFLKVIGINIKGRYPFYKLHPYSDANYEILTDQILATEPKLRELTTNENKELESRILEFNAKKYNL